MCTLFLDGIFLIFVSFFQVLLSTLFGFYFLIFLCAFFFARYLHAKKDTVAFSFTYKKTTVSFFKSVSGTAPGSSPLLFLILLKNNGNH